MSLLLSDKITLLLMCHISSPAFVSHVSPYCLSHAPPYFFESVSSCLWVTCSPLLFVTHVSHYFFESHITLLFVSHVPPYFWVIITLLFVSHFSFPYYLWVICNTTFVIHVSHYFLWATYHPTVCESRTIPLFYSFATAADETVSVYEREGFGGRLRRGWDKAITWTFEGGCNRRRQVRHDTLHNLFRYADEVNEHEICRAWSTYERKRTFWRTRRKWDAGPSGRAA
jgi:hypothetical protein